ncbi:MAG: hypothetical protein EBY24_01560 [Betaproteobacteria bacterium]|nr:hypothetical protein [Betaproteobacteria bacterium]
MPVPLYGQLANRAPILELARRHGLRGIEDVAQVHGAPLSGARSIGCLPSALKASGPRKQGEWRLTREVKGDGWRSSVNGAPLRLRARRQAASKVPANIAAK